MTHTERHALVLLVLALLSVSSASAQSKTHGYVSVGGGAAYWLAARVGLRGDAFKFLPVSTDNNIRAEARSPSRYWGVRAGVVFRFR
jgi:hypothetical protein